MNYLFWNENFITDLQRNDYKRFLQIVGSLSALYSDSDIPYLYYRAAENIFCKAFLAENLSRSDISIDAKKNDIGIGLKTFLLKNGLCLEKIAEFNRQNPSFRNLNPEDLIKHIADLRNLRLDSTARIAKTPVEKMLYHCVVRDKGKFSLSEYKMSKIDIPRIKLISVNEHSISFADGTNLYSFNRSKSTLFMRFDVRNPICSFDVEILNDPLSKLEKLLSSSNQLCITNQSDSVILPLYSEKNNKKYVPERSGLNQWNANGRTRDPNEVYIKIPAFIHRYYPNFFPPKDVKFKLSLPSRETLSVKVCQDNSKALMSDPNKALGKWILRDVLMLQENELLTYERLDDLGIDSIEIQKNGELDFSVNYKTIGSFESFKENTIL